MAFSMRRGGWSPQPFDSLNFSVTQGDTQDNVQRNFGTLAASLDLDPNRIVRCRQVHSDRVIVVEDVPSVQPEADAVLTPVPGLFAAVKTADCLPLLIVDPVKRVAGAVHAGWRGTVLRIVTKVLDELGRRFRSNAEDLIVALGPAIGSCCYEVDDAVLTPFRKAIPEPNRFISVHASRNSGSGQTPHLDLTAVHQWELLAAGVDPENIYLSGLCTCCNKELFYSHRRDGFRSGRHIALAGFKE
jgi:YfiH family protein